MSQCPFCAGTGELAASAEATVVHELPREDAWRSDLRQLLRVLHKAVIDDDIERANERRRNRELMPAASRGLHHGEGQPAPPGVNVASNDQGNPPPA